MNEQNLAFFKVSLASARVNAGLSQCELAEILGVTKNTICNWEAGKTTPDYNQVRRISELSKIPINYIFLP